MNEQQKMEHQLWADVVMMGIGSGRPAKDAAKTAKEVVALYREQYSDKTATTNTEYTSALPWYEAPDWAMYAAMDKDGEWFWFEDKPHEGGFLWVEISDKDFEYFDHPTFTGCWKDSLQRRPS